MTKRTDKRTEPQPKEQALKPHTWIIESGTRGTYVGGDDTHRSANWPLFTWSPDPARIIRFDDREAAETELARARSFATNARLWEVG
jgi:hypothetical protein